MLENIEWHFVQQVLLVSSVLEALLLFSWSFEKYIVAIFFSCMHCYSASVFARVG